MEIIHSHEIIPWIFLVKMLAFIWKEDKNSFENLTEIVYIYAKMHEMLQPH